MQRQEDVTALTATIDRYLADHPPTQTKTERAAPMAGGLLGSAIEATKAVEPANNAAIFKPRTLQHEASINEFLQWQGRFRAYYDQSNMAEQGPTLHRAFLLTCIDDNLAGIIQTRLKHSDRVFTRAPTPPRTCKY